MACIQLPRQLPPKNLSPTISTPPHQQPPHPLFHPSPHLLQTPLLPSPLSPLPPKQIPNPIQIPLPNSIPSLPLPILQTLSTSHAVRGIDTYIFYILDWEFDRWDMQLEKAGTFEGVGDYCDAVGVAVQEVVVVEEGEEDVSGRVGVSVVLWAGLGDWPVALAFFFGDFCE